MTYTDRLDNFHRYLFYHDVPPHAQLLYFHLLNLNNQLGWQENFCITDRRLEYSTGLSEKLIADAKRILSNIGFVRTKTEKKNSCSVTTYVFPDVVSELPEERRE